MTDKQIKDLIKTLASKRTTPTQALEAYTKLRQILDIVK